MKTFALLLKPLSVLIVLFSSFFIRAQEPEKTPGRMTDDEILRVNTNLIQTGFSVLNKKGEFVKGLGREDFELRIDGKPVSTVFFDFVVTKVDRGIKPGEKLGTSEMPVLVNGLRRTMIFVVDDLHLAGDNLIRTRKMILKFIDEQMLANDRIAIVSSGGKIGFLQQFTSDKTMLRAAATRLSFNGQLSGPDTQKPPMDEYAAQCIERGDRDVTNYFVSETVRIEKMFPNQAESLVQSRARAVLSRTRVLTSTSLTALEATVKESSRFQGRKAIFFISDGFLLDPGNSDATTRLNRITDAAARSNTVINSFDAKGLDASLPDDTTGLNFFLQSGRRFELQDGLSFVANNTGGKFIHNTNGLQEKLEEVAGEAFTYYLLAWEPEVDSAPSSKLKKIEVIVKGRPELKVLVQNGYLPSAWSEPKDKKKITEQQSVKLPDVSKPSVLQQNALATAVAVRYLNLPEKGSTISVTVQISTVGLQFTETNGSFDSKVEIAGVVYDADGKQAHEFKIPVDIKIPTSDLRQAEGLSFNYDYETSLKSGLYQIRVTTRDLNNGLTGFAAEWIDIPDLSSKKLTMSSLILGERRNDSRTKNGDAPLERKVENRFERTSSMRFMGFIYNASDGKLDSEPDLSIQMQILRAGKIVGNGTPNLVELEPKDKARIPFAGELFLDTFNAGMYELKLIVTDRRTNKSIVQLTRFEVL